MKRKLAENKARLLILGCTEISKTWPACGWILRLFETIFRNLEERGSQEPSEKTKDTQLKPASCPEEYIPNQAIGEENDAGIREHHTISEQTGMRTCENDATENFQFDPQMFPFLDISGVLDLDLLNGFSQDADDENVRTYAT